MGFKDLVHRTFDDYSEFRQTVRENSEFAPLAGRSRVIWRGQRDPNWPLSSAWERYVKAQIRPGTSKADREKLIRAFQSVEQARFLQRFKENLSGLPGMPRIEDLHPQEKVWAIGRHHGLITPLLDWSEKPYIALFFAVADLLSLKVAVERGHSDLKIADDDEVALYRLEAGEDMQASSAQFSELKLVWTKYDVIGRLLAQKGLFSWLQSSTQLDLVDYLGSIDELGRISRYILRGQAILEAIDDLESHGIDWRLVYPDVDGAALCTNSLLYQGY
jgi:hypothetical protein